MQQALKVLRLFLKIIPNIYLHHYYSYPSCTYMYVHPLFVAHRCHQKQACTVPANDVEYGLTACPGKDIIATPSRLIINYNCVPGKYLLNPLLLFKRYKKLELLFHTTVLSCLYKLVPNGKCNCFLFLKQYSVVRCN